MRLAYVDFDGAAALEAIPSSGDGRPIDRTFLETWCGDMLEATERI